MERSAPSSVEIKARRMNFQHTENKPRYWHHGDAFMTHALTSASIFFPEGERFFIRSVRNYQDQVSDPKLQEDIKGFIAQEATHGHEHTKYNADIVKQGYGFLRPVERQVKVGLALLNKYTPKQFQLAITVALEHITAISAGMLLAYPQLMEGVAPEHQEIWLWHAVEETEHKGVAFDVYNEVGGQYWVRVLALLLATLSFIPAVFLLLGRFLWIDKKLTRQTWQELKNYHQGKSFIFKEVGGHYLDYYRKDFHPWEVQNQQHIEDWKAQNDRQTITI
ncbi:MAG: metal-dependent hydrolase [Gammaproteobacteria bacterium]|nr:MAG: metal-dependent hydrolase [Gammaproteobacteria bacterium]